MAISTMGPPEQDYGESSATWDPYGSYADPTSGTCGIDSGCPPDLGQSTSLLSLPVAHSGDDEKQQTLGTPTGPLSKQHLDADTGKTPPASTQADTTGADTCDGLTQEIMIPPAMTACLKLQLGNQRNDCCVNANVLAFTWYPQHQWHQA